MSNQNEQDLQEKNLIKTVPFICIADQSEPGAVFVIYFFDMIELILIVFVDFFFKCIRTVTRLPVQGNLKQGNSQLALKNRKNLFGNQREDTLTSLEVCYLL